jgi:hypothetical protein
MQIRLTSCCCCCCYTYQCMAPYAPSLHSIGHCKDQQCLLLSPSATCCNTTASSTNRYRTPAHAAGIHCAMQTLLHNRSESCLLHWFKCTSALLQNRTPHMQQAIEDDIDAQAPGRGTRVVTMRYAAQVTMQCGCLLSRRSRLKQARLSRCAERHVAATKIELLNDRKRAAQHRSCAPTHMCLPG